MSANEIVVDRPRYSIVCTLRNNYRCFFEELLDHFVSQAEDNYECIFIVDEDAVDWVKTPDSRFKVTYLDEELPLAQKRNIGIEKAVGDYIVFCDADDYFDKNLLKTFSEIIDHYAPDLIIPKVSRNKQDFAKQNQHSIDISNLIDDKEKIIETFFSRYLFGKAQSNELLLDACWGRAFKREILIENGISFLSEPCRAEDALFVNDFIVKANSVYFIEDYIGYYWRLNQKSEMFNVNSFFFNIVPFSNKLLLQVKSVPEIYSRDLYFYISYRIISQAIIFCRAKYKNQIDKTTFNMLLDNSAPYGSFCRECLNKTSWKYGFVNKFLCLLYSLRLYSVFYLFFCIKQRLKK